MFRFFSINSFSVKSFSVFSCLIFFFLLNFTLLPKEANASEILITPPYIKVEQGDFFDVNFLINPTGDAPVSVKMNSVFTPNVISLSTWKFSSGWTPDRAYANDFFSNEQGSLIRTGYFFPSVSTLTPFGTATFKAESLGQAVIYVKDNSLITDTNGKSTLLGSNTIIVDVWPKTGSGNASSNGSEEGLEENLLPAENNNPKPPKDPNAQSTSIGVYSFDVSLNFSKNNFTQAEVVTAFVNLINNSSVDNGDLQVPLIYSIYSENNTLVSQEIKVEMIEATSTDFVYNPSLKNLPPGQYRLKVEVNPKNLTKPAEMEKTFSISSVNTANNASTDSSGERRTVTIPIPDNIVLYGVGGAVLIILLAWLVFRKRVVS